MEKKRERSDIIYDILRVVRDHRGEMKPTHVMYKANLAYRQLKTYLKELEEAGMVEYRTEGRNKRVVITNKGLRFIEKMQEMKEFEKMFGFRSGDDD